MTIKPKVFFTGSNGFLASNFIDYIRECPEDFEDYDLVFGYLGREPDVADIGYTVECNLECPDEVESVFFGECMASNSIIIHMASVVGGINFHVEHPADAYHDINLMDSNVVECAHLAGIYNILYTGSACGYPPECYDGNGLIYEDMFGTGDPEDTILGYGSAKKEMLTRLRVYGKQYGLKSCYPIVTNMFGKYDNFDEVTGHVIPALISKVAKDPNILVVRGTGEPVRDFLPAANSVRYLWHLARNNMSTNPDPINVGHGCGISVNTILRMITEHLKWEGRVDYDTSKTDGTMKRILDVSLLEEVAPILMPFTQATYETMMAEEIGKTIDWYMNGKN